jgi:hypothetical protein
MTGHLALNAYKFSWPSILDDKTHDDNRHNQQDKISFSRKRLGHKWDYAVGRERMSRKGFSYKKNTSNLIIPAQTSERLNRTTKGDLLVK